MSFVVYLTRYHGTLLPPKYIGSAPENKVKSGLYFGTITSKKWSKIFKEELRNNKNLFSIEILSYHETRQEALSEEFRLQKLNDVVKSGEYFNEGFASKNFFHGNKHTEKTKNKLSISSKNVFLNLTQEQKTRIFKKISESNKRAWQNPSTNEKLIKANGSYKNKGRKHSAETILNMSKAHLGFKQNKETIEKRVKKLRGQKRTEETKKLISMKRKGSKISEQGRKNMSNAAKNRKVSLESKLEKSRKLSLSKKKPRKQFALIAPNTIKFTFNGLKAVKLFAKLYNLSITLLKKYKNKGKIVSLSNRALLTHGWEFLCLKRL